MAEVDLAGCTVQQESSRSPEAWPSVLFDTSLGEMVTNIEVDIEYIADFLSRAGLSDEQIMDTTLRFDGETVLYGRGNKYTQFGIHKPDAPRSDSYTAHVHLGSARQLAIDYEEDQERIGDPIEDLIKDEIKDWIANGVAYETAIHELTHEVERVVVGDDALAEERLAHYQAEAKPTLVMRLVRWALSTKMLENTDTSELSEVNARLETTNKRIAAERAKKKGTHEQYKALPEEKRAEAMAAEAISQFEGADKFPVHAEFKW